VKRFRSRPLRPKENPSTQQIACGGMRTRRFSAFCSGRGCVNVSLLKTGVLEGPSSTSEHELCVHILSSRLLLNSTNTCLLCMCQGVGAGEVLTRGVGLHEDETTKRSIERVAAAADFEELKESSKPKPPRDLRHVPAQEGRRSSLAPLPGPDQALDLPSPSLAFQERARAPPRASPSPVSTGVQWDLAPSLCPLFARSPSRLFPNPASFLGSAPYMTLAA